LLPIIIGESLPIILKEQACYLKGIQKILVGPELKGMNRRREILLRTSGHDKTKKAPKERVRVYICAQFTSQLDSEMRFRAVKLPMLTISRRSN